MRQVAGDAASGPPAGQPANPADPSGQPRAWASPGSEPGHPPPGYPPPGYPPPGPALPYYGFAPPRPGLIPLRPLSVGEVLDGAFSVLRQQPRTVLTLSLVVALLNTAFAVVLPLLFGQGFLARTGTGIGSFIRPGSLLAAGLSTVTSAWLAGLLAVIVSEAVLGQRVRAAQAWARIRGHLPGLAAVGLITRIGADLGLAALVIPGLFLWGAWALALPALVLERTGVTGALRRSWRLAVPDWWRVWGIRALGTLIAGAVSVVLVLPAGVLGAIGVVEGVGHGSPPGSTSIGVVLFALTLSTLAQILTVPFMLAVQALLYVDRRMRAEALDLSLQQVAAARTRSP